MPAPAKAQNDGSSDEEEVTGTQIRELLSRNTDLLGTNEPYTPPVTQSAACFPPRKTKQGVEMTEDLLQFDNDEPVKLESNQGSAFDFIGSADTSNSSSSNFEPIKPPTVETPSVRTIDHFHVSEHSLFIPDLVKHRSIILIDSKSRIIGSSTSENQDLTQALPQEIDRIKQENQDHKYIEIRVLIFDRIRDEITDHLKEITKKNIHFIRFLVIDDVQLLALQMYTSSLQGQLKA